MTDLSVCHLHGGAVARMRAKAAERCVSHEDLSLEARIVELLGPALPARPACAGRAPLFDGQGDGEPTSAAAARHREAAAICARCPALDACTTLLPALPAAAGGVWAGHVVTGERTRSLLPDTAR